MLPRSVLLLGVTELFLYAHSGTEIEKIAIMH